MRTSGSLLRRGAIGCRGLALALFVLLAALPGIAQAAAYLFPGKLPAGCTNPSGNSFSCGGLNLASSDTITIVNKPATISFSGQLSTQAAQINAAGASADLTLNANAGLVTASGARIVATVNVSSLNDGGGVVFTGNVSTLAGGGISLGNATVVSGNVSTSAGNLVLYTGAQVGGTLSSTSGTISLYNGTRVGSSISCSCEVYVNSSATVQGDINAGYFNNNAGSSTFNGSVTTSSSNLVIGPNSSVAGSLSAANGWIYLLHDSSVSGSVDSIYGVSARVRSRVNGNITTGSFDNGEGSSVFGGSITARTNNLVLGNSSTVAGLLNGLGGWIYLYSDSSVAGSVMARDGVYAYARSAVQGDISTITLNNGGGGSRFGGNITTTTGGMLLGDSTQVTGSISATTGGIRFYNHVTVGGSVSCQCYFDTDLYDSVGGAVWVDTLADGGNTSYGATVTSRYSAALGSASRITGDLSSTEGSVDQNSSSTVSGCVRSRGSSIVLRGSTASGGVCCGSGSCSSSCVSNQSGHAMPPACASTLPAAYAEYRFDEASWNGTTGEVKDSGGAAHHASKLASVSVSTIGKLCNAASIPSDASSTSQAISSPIDIDNAIGAHGSIVFWYRTPAAWSAMAPGELFDATVSSGKTFHLIRQSSGIVSFYVADGQNVVVSASTPAQSFTANTWVHIAATWSLDYHNARLQIYINGVATSATSASSQGGISSSLGLLYIGDSRANITGNGGSLNSANGLIDEFQVFNVALSSTEVSTLKARTRGCDAASGTLVAGTRYSFESYDWPGWYVRQQDFIGKLSQYGGSPDITQRSDATFIARAGLSDGTCWSFESISHPGYYLRQQAFSIVLQAASDAGSYPQDATFCLRAGLADTSAISLESRGYPGYFIYHRADASLALGSSDGTPSFDGTATFRVISPFADGGLHHVEIRHSSGTGLTCTPSTLTLVACQDAACAMPYVEGLSGTVTATGVTTRFPSGSGFSIPAGSSSVNVSVQLTAEGTALLGLTNLSASTHSGTSCNFGTPSCTFRASNAGLLLDVPDHVADVAQSFTVSAVRKSDKDSACTAAFANVVRSLSFQCGYLNPGSGSLPARVGGVALNGSANPAAACDGSGRSIPLIFNASGVATTTLQYADVGSLALSATYTGSVITGDDGVVLAGSDSFIAAPFVFALGVPVGSKTAGLGFSATVTALNFLGAITPNFGRESAPEGVAAGWVRTLPQGAGASNGLFSPPDGFGSFSGGWASASNLQWSEVGWGDLSVVLASGSYLQSGLTAAGSTAGPLVPCAVEGGSCQLPTGAIATIYFGAGGRLAMLAGRSGSVACTTAMFGDPASGSIKSCWYVLTSGASGVSPGTVGPFLPHHLDLSTTNACGSFSYASQPFGSTVTARNAAGLTTTNYDGSGSLLPVLAKTLSLLDVSGLGLGALSGNTVGPTAFASGVASVGTTRYTFSQKLTPPQTLRLRAMDADGISSSGYTEGLVPLRSGRLALSNAFGSERSSLKVPLRLQYWSGNSWVLNSADTCTSIPASAVVRPVVRNHDGSAGNWTSVVTGVTLAGGSGAITLAAPSPAATGTVDLAVNLGSGVGIDLSCLSANLSSTGVGAPWLRSRNGNCAANFDRDPSARASFGVFAPETRKTVHIQELF